MRFCLRYFVPIVLAMTAMGTTAVQAQTCLPDVFSALYQGNAAYTDEGRIETPLKELVSVGRVLQVDNIGFDYDAWAYKLSPRGQVLWAKRYMLAGFNAGSFTCVAALPDGSCLVGGEFRQLVRNTTTFQIETVNSITVLFKLDAYGNVQWTKVMAANTSFALVRSLTALSDGRVLGMVDVFNSGVNRQLLFCFDAQGNMMWNRSVSRGTLQVGGVCFGQLRNGTLVTAGWLLQPNETGQGYTKQGFYIMSLNPTSGAAYWSREYLFSNTQQGNIFSASPVRQLTEQANGAICLFSSFSSTASFPQPPFTEQAVMLRVNPSGNLLNAVGYRNGTGGCAVADAKAVGNDEHLLLLNDTNGPLLTRTNQLGAVLWQRGYGGVNSNLKASAVFPTPSHVQVYFSGKGEVAMSSLIRTEPDGRLSCAETPEGLQASDATNDFTELPGNLTTQPADNNLFVLSFFAIRVTTYAVQPELTCVPQCCNNVGSDTTSLQFCNRPFYQLPDGVRVAQSGRYYTQHTTSQGCDSIAFYQVELTRTPQPNLGEDRCLEGNDSIVLTATGGGAPPYNWMGSSQPDSVFVVRRPGLYWVRSTNACGTGTDSVAVLAKCDFDVYLPSAFTPNGDGRNDVFRFPLQNRNKLKALTVFNRWGQTVFRTMSASLAWDGTLGNRAQPTGVYAYLLETINLRGEVKHQTGTITLIR